MFDNEVLNALQYLGYDINYLKKNKLLFRDETLEPGVIYNSDDLSEYPWLSDIRYSGGHIYPASQHGGQKGYDQLEASYYETYGMVCATFVNWYYLQYLKVYKGVKGLNEFETQLKYTETWWQGPGGGSDTNASWVPVPVSALIKMVNEGAEGAVRFDNLIEKKKFLSGTDDYPIYEVEYKEAQWAKLQPGDILWFSRVPDAPLPTNWQANTARTHIAIYLGEGPVYNKAGKLVSEKEHFIAHVAEDHGPEISTAERTLGLKDDTHTKSSYPVAAFRIGQATPVEASLSASDSGSVNVSVKANIKKIDPDGEPLKGAKFDIWMSACTDDSITIDKTKHEVTTNSQGIASYKFGTFKKQWSVSSFKYWYVENWSSLTSDQQKAYTNIDTGKAGKDNKIWYSTKAKCQKAIDNALAEKVSDKKEKAKMNGSSSITFTVNARETAAPDGYDISDSADTEWTAKWPKDDEDSVTIELKEWVVTNDVTANELPLSASDSDSVNLTIKAKVKKINAINQSLAGAKFDFWISACSDPTITDKSGKSISEYINKKEEATTDANGEATVEFGTFEKPYNVPQFTYWYVENWNELTDAQHKKYPYIDTGTYDPTDPRKIVWYSSEELCQKALDAELKKKVDAAIEEAKTYNGHEITFTINTEETKAAPGYETNYPTKSAKQWTTTWGANDVINLAEYTAINYIKVEPAIYTNSKSDQTNHEILLEVKKWNDNTKNPEWPDEGLEGFKFNIVEKNTLAKTNEDIYNFTTDFKNGIYTTNSSGSIAVSINHHWDVTYSASRQYMPCNWSLLCDQDKQQYSNLIHFEGSNGEEKARAEAERQVNEEIDTNIAKALKKASNAVFEYTVTESEVPEGSNYILDPTPQVQTGVGNSDPKNPLRFYFEQDNPQQMGTITIIKKGQALMSVSDGTGNQHKVFNYAENLLPCAEYEIYAAENIKRSQHYRVYDKGDLVATVVTGKDGTAVSPELYIGKYTVIETKAPTGYTLPEDEALRTHNVELVYGGQTVDLVTTSTEYKNDRPTSLVTLSKKDNQDDTPLANAVYTLYNTHDIYNFAGDKVLDANTAIETLVTGTDGKVTALSDLPINYDYYIIETTAPENYINNPERWEIHHDYKNDTTYSYTYTHEFTDDEQRANIKVFKVDKELFIDPVRTPENDIIYRDGRQGDASLEGAIYGLYAGSDIKHPSGNGEIIYHENEEIARVIITKHENDEYYGTFENLYLGEYYVKELQSPTGYLTDGSTYDVELKYAGQWEPAGITDVKLVRRNSDEVVSWDEVMTQPFKILKYLPSEINPSVPCPRLKSAEFTVKLKSDINDLIAQGKSAEDAWELAETYDTLVTDDWGAATSKELPFGTYIVRETEMPHEHHEDLYKVNDFEVVVDHDEREYQVWRILPDGPVTLYVRIYKIDKNTGEEVLVPGATFQLLRDGQLYRQKVGDKWIDTFKTDEKGWVQLPIEIESGNYTVVEIHAPEGYLVNDEDLDFSVDLNAPVRVDEDGDNVMDINYKDEAVVGQIEVAKQGEVLVDAVLPDTGSRVMKTDFKYQVKYLAGASYQIIAADDIMTPDNHGTIIYPKGQVIETITTKEDGKALSSELPLGKYIVKEVGAPEGYVLLEGEAAEKEVTLKYVDENTPVVFDRSSIYTNERQKVEIKIQKVDKATREPLVGAVFGLFAKNDIVNDSGDVIVPKDSLIEIATSNMEGIAEITSDLPLGQYYVKELTPPDGYATFREDIDFDASYQGQAVKKVEITKTAYDEMTVITAHKFDDALSLLNFKALGLEGATMQILETNNDPDNLQVIPGAVIDEWVTTTEPHQIKKLTINTYYALVEKNAPYGYFNGGEPVWIYVKDTADEQDVEMSNTQIRGRLEVLKLGEMLVDATVNDDGKIVFKYENRPLEGVKFDLFAAEDIHNVDGQSEDWYKKDQLVTSIVTGEDGTATVEALPLGKYYLKETATVDGMVLSTERYDVEIKSQGQTVPVVTATKTIENARQRVDVTIKKTDVETGIDMPATEFTMFCHSDILSYDGKVLVKADTPISVAVTDETGYADFGVEIPVGYKYYIKETASAPGYTTNGGEDDIYEFDASYGGPDKSTVTIDDLHASNLKTKHVFRKVDINTNEPLSGAVLSILKIEKDENGKLMKDENGEYITSVITTWVSDRNEQAVLDDVTYDGHLVEGLVIGETYIFREVTAPYGYVGYDASSEETKKANEADIIFTVEDIKGMIEHVMRDQATVGSLAVNKSGEVLVGFEEPSFLDKAKAYIARIFNWMFGKLEDVTFEVYAAEDIKHPDGVSDDIYKKGDLIAEITTNYLGIARLDNLPLGSYLVKEKNAPDGFVTDVIPRTLSLVYINQDVPVVQASTDVVNQRQHIRIEVVKKASFVDEFKYMNTDEEIPDQPDLYEEPSDDIEQDTEQSTEPSTEPNTEQDTEQDNTTEEEDEIEIPFEERFFLLENAVFGLYNKEPIYANIVNEDGSVTKTEDIVLPPDTLIEVVVTDKNGSGVFQSDLPFGSYYIKELEAPAGFHTSDEVVEFVLESTDHETFVYDKAAFFMDKPTIVSVDKIAEDTNEGLIGAKLGILDADGNIVDSWVTDGTTHYTKHLELGKTYTLKELETPVGYATFNPVEFTVLDRDEENNIIELQPIEPIVDETIKVQISKKDMTTGEELPGAKLQLFDENGTLVDEWVSEEEAHYIEKLPVGKYRLHEEITPDGYVTAHDVEFTVEDTGEVQQVEMLDDITRVEISKKDMTTGEELPGAKLQLFDEEGNLVDEWTSTEEPHYIEKLPIGKYRLHEEITPDGYVTANDVEFTVEDTGEVQQVEMLDDITRVEISKKDMTTGEELPGAKLQLFDEEGNLIDEWTSTEEPHYIEKLPVGKYRLHEETAPDGYVTAEDVEFTVEDTGEIQQVEMLDDITKVEISKKDMTNGEELPGAKLQLFDENGNLIDEWVSEDTPHYIEKLPVGKYRLHEETAPNGYVTAEDVEFTVEDTGEIQKAEMLDDITRVEISKKDMTTGEELPGAKLQLFDENGNLIDEWVTDGTPHYIEKLPVGKYTLREITAPDGYVTAEDVEFVVDDTGEIQKVEMLDDVTKVDIWKKESVNKKPLAGAVMQIINANGNVVKEWTSSTNEAFHIEKLPVGEYKLHEAEAPSGYTLHADVAFTVKDTGELQTFEMEDTPVEVVKTGEDQVNYAFLILALGCVLVVELLIVSKMKKRRVN